ncbi:AbrB family transcriptional regulator [Stappia albiluteola]|nr:AbrB family transcriptional regulator [Stappia albiluteola]
MVTALLSRLASLSIVARVVFTIVVGTLGGLAFEVVGLPAAWLSGAMVFVAIATFANLPTLIPNRLRDSIFVVLGISMGSGVRPDVVERVAEWPITMGVLAVTVVAVTGATYAFLRWVGHWNKEAAFFGAIPGALSFVIALASERSADLSRIAVSQSFRLFVLVALLPSLIVHATDHPDAVAAPAAVELSLAQAALLFALCIAASFGAVRLRVPGGWLTGAFFMSSAINAFGFMPVALPQWMVVPCYVALGAMVGARFGNTNLLTFLRLLAASFGAFLVGFAISVAAAWAVSVTLGLPFGQLILAYAPGGLEAMTLLAFVLNLDPAFVAGHQLARYIGMVLMLPLVTRLVLGPKAPLRVGAE